jgi:hypothetical protein
MEMIIKVVTYVDQVLGLGEEASGKQNRIKAKVISIGPFCFGDQHT